VELEETTSSVALVSSNSCQTKENHQIGHGPLTKQMTVQCFYWTLQMVLTSFRARHHHPNK